VNEISYDVVIVGAGIAGSSVAYFLRNRGFKVLLLDIKSFERVGDKPCGDAIGKHHIDELGVPPPAGNELSGLVKGIDIYSPLEDIRYRVLGDGFEINRVTYTQKFITEAIKGGIEFMERARALKLIIRDNSVAGVIIADCKGTRKVRSKVVIDATGVARVLARQCPREWPVSDELDPKDTNIAYREVRKLKEPIDEPEILRIYVSNKVAPGGYWWFFPYSLTDGFVNVGLGVQGGVGNPHPKLQLYKYVLSRSTFKDSVLIEAGGAPVPTRRPLPSLVWNGIAVIGDAAYTVNPIHGGGKGSAMLSAYCVAEAVASALNEGDCSARKLWRANTCYMLRYGAKQAALDIFRIFLQHLSDDDLEYGMRKKIIKEEDLNVVSLQGDLELSVVDKAMRLLAGLGRPSLLLRLRAVSKYMDVIKKHYLKFPEDPVHWRSWKARSDQIMGEFKAKVIKS